ncbi:MAG: serine hydrolase [Flavobacteriaceae bacterium]|nr:serine hydrolase [Flavobacteriaceae bacterium]
MKRNNFFKMGSLTFILIFFVFRGELNAQSKLYNRLDHYMSNASYFGFSGALLVEKNDEIVLSKGYGFANKEYLVPFTDSIIIDIASCTKTFTATAILQLHDQGKLNVNDKITRYFENVPDDKSNITIGQLLSNSSGLGEYLSARSDISRDSYITKVLERPFEGKPNTWFYSNDGFSILAAIIEKVSGITFEEYVLQHFIEPLKMMHTGFFGDKKWDEKYLGHSYNREKDYGSFTNNNNQWSDKGSGNMASSLLDMYKWVKASMRNDFLKQNTYDLQFKPHVKLNPKWQYGYGWFLVTSDRGTKVLRFGGNNTPAGITIEVRIFPEEDAMYILFCNEMVDETGLVRPLRDNIEKMIFDSDFENKLSSKEIVHSSSIQNTFYLNSWNSKTIIEPYLDQYLLKTENQEIVNAIIEPEYDKKKQLLNYNNKAKEMLNMLLKGIYPDKELQDYFWKKVKLKDFKVLCTAPLSDSYDGTFVKVWTPLGQFIFICLWENDELLYINDETNELPSWRMVKTQNGFLGYDLILNKEFTIKRSGSHFTIISNNHETVFDI